MNFVLEKKVEVFEHLDIGHGRIESRKCSVISDFQFINNENEKWKSLKSVIRLESVREFKNSTKQTETAT